MNDRVVNLRQARKRMMREQERRKADANAVEHGRSKAERRFTDAVRRIDEDRLDGHKREDDD